MFFGWPSNGAPIRTLQRQWVSCYQWEFKISRVTNSTLVPDHRSPLEIYGKTEATAEAHLNKVELIVSVVVARQSEKEKHRNVTFWE